jgi:hypothetical protein
MWSIQNYCEVLILPAFKKEWWDKSTCCLCNPDMLVLCQQNRMACYPQALVGVLFE